MLYFKIVNKTILIFCVFFSVVFCGAAAAWAFNAKVIKVNDGDTLQVKKSDGSIIKIRLYGIDCPEYEQAYGKAAARFATQTVLHEYVTVQKINTDQYGRLVAIVTPQNAHLSLNELLVQKGYAWYYGQYCKTADFCNSLAKLEKSAIAQQAGLWREQNPVPPWEYRKNSKSATNGNDEDYALLKQALHNFGKWLQKLFKTAEKFYFN